MLTQTLINSTRNPNWTLYLESFCKSNDIAYKVGTPQEKEEHIGMKDTPLMAAGFENLFRDLLGFCNKIV